MILQFIHLSMQDAFMLPPSVLSAGLPSFLTPFYRVIFCHAGRYLFKNWPDFLSFN